MTKLKYRVSFNGYAQKPSEGKTKKNTNQLMRNLTDVPSKQFAEYLCHGYTACQGDVTCKFV